MKITFRLLTGAGGMVPAMCNGELNKMLRLWSEEYGDSFTLKSRGHLRELVFKSEDELLLFLRTFKPQREHWWSNAKIESSLLIINKNRIQ